MPSGIPAGSAPLPAGITNDSLKELVTRLLEAMEPLDLGEYEGFHYSRTSRATRLISLQFTKGTFTPLDIATRMGWPVLREHYQPRVPNTEKSND